MFGYLLYNGVMSEEILTVNQFAERLGTTRQVVHKMIKEGRILAFRLSNTATGRYRIKSSEIDRLISFELNKKYIEE